MKKLDQTKIDRQIREIMQNARSCDWGEARSTTIFGGGIRVMTSQGQHRSWGNHNFPIWEDPKTSELLTLQIETPSAHIVPLLDYLYDLYYSGGSVIICRPDVFSSVRPSPGTERHLRVSWMAMDGTNYDKTSIKQIFKMYIRWRKKIRTNDKTTIYCTEGTFAPFVDNIKIWMADAFVGETHPVPIHSEHAMRAKRAIFIAGNRAAYDLIMTVY